jgi:energy-coupling factor transporter transmembrane protein EcfT
MSQSIAGAVNSLLFGLLTILFVGLKLTGHIAWSWWWVLAPLWLPTIIILIVVGAFVLGVIVRASYKTKTPLSNKPSQEELDAYLKKYRESKTK